MKDLGFDELKSRLERYCAYQERCTHEVSEKIKSFGVVDPSTSKKLTRHLVENSFLNEGRFVEAYIEGKVTIKRWGVNKIRNELFKKFVSKEYIDQGILNINRDLYKDNLDGLALKKRASLKKEPSSYVIKNKVLRFLASKGYTLEDCEHLF